jgi:16S rRNA (cytosine967-C5)-methyltransferase
MTASPNPDAPQNPPEAADAAQQAGSGGVGLAAREAALAVMRAGLDHRGGFDEALARPPFTTLRARDRAWARALAATALRRLGPIDAALAARLQKPPPERVVAILRLGVAQLLFRDTPAFAAVATSVDLAEADKASRPFKGLVNAVLRRLARDGVRPGPPEQNLPPWLFARWAAAFGEAAALAIAETIPLEPPTDLSLRDPADAAALAEAFEAETLPGGTLRIPRRGEILDWPEFAEGRWWVQDAAAAIPARLLAAGPGETALDLCAAPGGKTLQLAAAGAQVTALDRSPARLKRLHQNLERTGLSAEVVAADAAAWADPRRFDAVLLDAPCTATGTFRRHPDVLWTVRPGEVAKLAEVQARLLDAAAERVRPGGRLVYCVCSLEPEEGEAQAAAFLARRPDFHAAPIGAGEGGAPPDALTAAGTLRLTPAAGMDGFFVARFARTG